MLFSDIFVHDFHSQQKTKFYSLVMLSSQCTKQMFIRKQYA